jgi:hypothetical protein
LCCRGLPRHDFAARHSLAEFAVASLRVLRKLAAASDNRLFASVSRSCGVRSWGGRISRTRKRVKSKIARRAAEGRQFSPSRKNLVFPDDFRSFSPRSLCKSYNEKPRFERASLGRHADRAVETNRLPVEHFVADDVFDKRREFAGTAQPRRKGNLLSQALPDLV